MKKFLSVTFIVVLAMTMTACKARKPQPSVQPSAGPPASVSVTPSVSVAPGVSVAPTVTTSVTPSVQPSVTVSVAPTVTTSVTPSVAPSVLPSVAPSVVPTVQPTAVPSVTPGVSVTPTVIPSVTPTTAPTVAPTVSVIPTVNPTVAPSVQSSVLPSVEPSVSPEEQLQAVTFTSASKMYNGAHQKLEVKNLPQGATVEYAVNDLQTSINNTDVYGENGARKPGVYGLIATVSYEGLTRELYASLTIRKAPLTIQINSSSKELYAPHPEFTYTVSGLKGDDVFYFGEPEVPEGSVEVPEGGEGSLEGGSESNEGGEGEAIPEEPIDYRAIFTGDLIIEATVERYSTIGGSIVATSLPTSDCYDVRATEGSLTIKPLRSKLIGGTSGGLKMDGDYNMIYNGKVVKWQGVNYFDLWQNCFNYNTGAIVESWVQESMRGLEELAAYNVKAIRFSASFFYHNWWQSCFMDYDEATDSFHVGKKAEEAIYVMHRIFNKAASLGIGLIPSVFWTHNQYKLFPGETLEDCLINTDSESFKFTQWYQDLLIENFNDHPALFMWEQGNEWNLAVDHSEDGLTSDVLIRGRRIWAEQIAAANVGYNRVIGSGDAVLRGSQYNLRHGGGWASDTHLQHTKVLEELNPGITAVSSHIYTNCALPLLIEKKQKEFNATVSGAATPEQLEEIANEWREKYYNDTENVVALFKEYGFVNEEGSFVGYTGPYNDKMTDVDTLEEMFDTLITASKSFKSTCYVGECGPGFTYGETVLQHSKYRNSTLSNGLVIEGDKLNAGLSETYSEENGYYPDVTYQDMLDYYMAVSAAQEKTGMPLVLYWNYEYSANINRLNDQKKINQLNYWGDRSTATEFSVSLNHFGKALCMLSEVKALNDAWDEANLGVYN